MILLILVSVGYFQFFLIFFPNEKEDLFLFITERSGTIAKDTHGK